MVRGVRKNGTVIVLGQAVCCGYLLCEFRCVLTVGRARPHVQGTRGQVLVGLPFIAIMSFGLCVYTSRCMVVMYAICSRLGYGQHTHTATLFEFHSPRFD